MDEQFSNRPLAERAYLGGVLLLALGLVSGYFCIYQPLHDLRTTGHMTYYLKGIVLPPLCIYMGVLAFTGKFRDGQIRKLNDKGHPTFTRKGWIAAGGALAVILLTFAAWYGYLSATAY